jgi:Transposase and inactivated derivatives
LNVLAALNALSHELLTLTNLTYITAATVCEWLRLLAGSYPGIAITVVLDNARYQRCALVQTVAQSFGIERLYLPPYSPHLNLIERFWRFGKKHCLYSKYYPDRESFQRAIMDCIEQAPSQHKAELKQWLTLRFQTFKTVLLVSDQLQEKVLSMAT